MNLILKLFRKKNVTGTEKLSRKKETKTENSNSVTTESETTSLQTPPSSVLVTESKASIAARRYIEESNSHCYEEMKALLASNCIAYFKDAEILGYASIDLLSNTRRSFPDFKVSYEKIVDIGPNVAKVCNVRASGTHTGEPYGFGPYPLIAATGNKVLNDPEEITVTIDERSGLITKLQFVTDGRLTGALGLYEQIGGILF